MITFSGLHMVPGGTNAPAPVDIATGMCRITRYAGAIWLPLAPHSLLVAELAYQRSRKLMDWGVGLLHDAHETVTGEVTRHWKPKEMREFEHELDRRIFREYELPYADYRERAIFFKECDEAALSAEATMLEYPGWADFYRKENGVEPAELQGPEEEFFAQRLLVESSFWRWCSMVDPHSEQIKTLAQVLEFVKKGRLDDARDRVRSTIMPPGLQVKP